MATRKTGQRRRSPSGRWMSVSTLPGVAAPTEPARTSSGRARHRTTRERPAVKRPSRKRPFGRNKRPVNRKLSSSAEHPSAEPRPGRRLLSVLAFARFRSGRGAVTNEGPALHPGALRASWPKALGVLVALGALSLGGYVGYHFITSSHYFSVRKVTFSATEHVSSEELRALAALSSKDNVFSVDLAAVAGRVASHPWVLSAKARRRLPGEIHIQVVEQQAAAAVLMGAMYLVNPKGDLFKRARYDEARALPLVTGIGRDEYEHNPREAKERIHVALDAILAYGSRKGRPLLGEVHVDERSSVTLYTRKTGLQIRLGRGAFLAKLSRFDAVWAALGDRRRNLRVVRLDNRVRPERVTVRLADDADLTSDSTRPDAGGNRAARGTRKGAGGGSDKAAGASKQSGRTGGKKASQVVADRFVQSE